MRLSSSGSRSRPTRLSNSSVNSMAETEKLIQTVYSYPLLYNVSCRDDRKSERRASAWREVAASVGLSVVECKLRKEDHVRKRKRHIKAEDLQDLSRTCQSPEGQLLVQSNTAPALLPTSAPATNINGQTEEAVKSSETAAPGRALDEDQLFLLSYVPALKRLTPQKRAAVKMKIQQVMFNAEFQDE